MRQLRVVGCLLVLAFVLGGCDNREFVGQQGYYAFAMTEAVGPFIAEDDATLFIVEQRVELPIREPTAMQMDELTAGVAGMTLPWPRLPWVERGDYEIEVDYVLSNLQDTRVAVAFVLNGFNEFDEYVPGAVVVNDDVVEDFHQYERHWILEPLERRRGTVREEIFDEMAVDLATVVNGAPNSNEVVHQDNHSDHDPRSMMYIPPVIPALTGFRAGLRTGAALNIVCEISVRVRDEEGKIVAQDQAWVLPVPTAFIPTVPEEEM